MPDLNSMNEEQLETIRKIGSAGVDNAAKAISKLFGCPVEIKIPKVEFIPAYDLDRKIVR
jgi:chemotaxis protein CheY-P-specific phosphatase CheC